nr:hypothetical protein [uncultured Ottowia sp.]
MRVGYAPYACCCPLVRFFIGIDIANNTKIYYLLKKIPISFDESSSCSFSKFTLFIQNNNSLANALFVEIRAH